MKTKKKVEKKSVPQTAKVRDLPAKKDAKGGALIIYSNNTQAILGYQTSTGAPGG